jgi:hypothetical protein
MSYTAPVIRVAAQIEINLNLRVSKQCYTPMAKTTIDRIEPLLKTYGFKKTSTKPELPLDYEGKVLAAFVKQRATPDDGTEDVAVCAIVTGVNAWYHKQEFIVWATASNDFSHFDASLPVATEESLFVDFYSAVKLTTAYFVKQLEAAESEEKE